MVEFLIFSHLQAKVPLRTDCAAGFVWATRRATIRSYLVRHLLYLPSRLEGVFPLKNGRRINRIFYPISMAIIIY